MMTEQSGFQATGGIGPQSYSSQRRIDRKKLLAWLSRHFGEVREKGRHLLVNDPRGRIDGTPDHKFNLVFWPEGRCFKSWIHQDWHGGILRFVMQQERCSFEQAQEFVGVPGSGMALDDASFNEVVSDLRHQESRRDASAALALKNIAALPPGFTLFSADDTLEKQGHDSLAALLRTRLVIERGIAPELFGAGYIEQHERTPVEIEGRWPDMRARVVMPFFGPDGSLIYWTARDMLERSPGDRTPRYFNMPIPQDPDLANAGRRGARRISADRAYIWCWDWSAHCRTVYLTEGVFDAQSLCLCGLFAIAISGAHLNDHQHALLRTHLRAETLVIAVDNDETGRAKRIEMARALQRRGWRVRITTPPDGYKDWNQLWSTWRDANAMRAWVENEEAPMSLATEVESIISAVPRL